MITLLDGHPHTLSFLGDVCLGVQRFGQSGDLAELYEHHAIDAESVVGAALDVMDDMSFTTRPELRGTFGMVASTHWLASGVGMSVLERGGNAFDAAVAAGFVLQVVEPHLNGPGGDVPAVFYSKAQDEVRVLCGQGPAPGAATIDAYSSRGLDLVPGIGPLAAVVPGAFDAWVLMLRELGTWELADVMAPAITYARDGYPVVPGIMAAIEAVEDQLRTEWTASAEIYLPAPQPGQLFRNLPLADAYGRLAQSQGGSREARIDAAREAFYEGWVAEAVDSVLRRGGRAADRRRPRAVGGDASRSRSRSTTTATRSARPARGGRAR